MLSQGIVSKNRYIDLFSRGKALVNENKLKRNPLRSEPSTRKASIFPEVN